MKNTVVSFILLLKSFKDCMAYATVLLEPYINHINIQFHDQENKYWENLHYNSE